MEFNKLNQFTNLWLTAIETVNESLGSKIFGIPHYYPFYKKMEIIQNNIQNLDSIIEGEIVKSSAMVMFFNLFMYFPKNCFDKENTEQEVVSLDNDIMVVNVDDKDNNNYVLTNLSLGGRFDPNQKTFYFKIISKNDQRFISKYELLKQMEADIEKRFIHHLEGF